MIDCSTRSKSQLSTELLSSCSEELTPEDADKMGSAKRWRAIAVAQAKIAVLMESEGRMREERGDAGEIGAEEEREIAAAERGQNRL